MANRAFKKSPSKGKSPINWHEKTHARSFTSMVQGIGNFVIVEVSPEEQAHRLIRSMLKVERKLKRLLEEKNKARKADSPITKDLEIKIKKAEEHYHWKALRLSLLQRRADTQTKRMQSRYENEKKREEIVRNKIEKIPVAKREDLPKGFNPVPRKELEEERKLAKRQVIKSPRGGTKLKSKRYGRWSNR